MPSLAISWGPRLSTRWPLELNIAGRYLQNTRDKVEHRCFPGTNRSEQGEDFPRLDLQAHVPHRNQRAEALHNAGHTEKNFSQLMQ